MIFFEGNNKKKQKDRIINLRNSLFFLSWPYKFIILHNPWMKYINIKDTKTYYKYNSFSQRFGFKCSCQQRNQNNQYAIKHLTNSYWKCWDLRKKKITTRRQTSHIQQNIYGRVDLLNLFLIIKTNNYNKVLNQKSHIKEIYLYGVLLLLLQIQFQFKLEVLWRNYF